ncbi:MAG: hypothetical protein ACTS4V_01065 [Candidatus Hodgkinia cicadicola]
MNCWPEGRNLLKQPKVFNSFGSKLQTIKTEGKVTNGGWRFIEAVETAQIIYMMYERLNRQGRSLF